MPMRAWGASAAIVGLAAAAVVTVGGGVDVAHAVTRTVSTVPGLRAAVGEANADASITEIVIDADALVVDGVQCAPGSGLDDDDANATGDLDFTGVQNLVIRGGRSERTTFTTDCDDRYFDHLGTGQLTLENLDLTFAFLPDVPTGLLDETVKYSGATVRSAGGDLVIRNMRFEENEAGSASDAEFSLGPLGRPKPGGDGGAIYSTGDVVIDRSLFIENEAGQGGDGDASFEASAGGDGGAVYADVVTVTDSTFSSNVAGFGGRAGDAPGGDGGDGGAIYAQRVIVVDTAFDTNVAGGGGDSTALRGGDAGDGGAVSAASFEAQRAVFVSNNGANGGDGFIGGDGGDGAAISAMTVRATDSSFMDNEAGRGGESEGTDATGGDGGDGGAIVGDDVLLDAVEFTQNRAGAGGAAPLGFGGRGGGAGAVAGGDRIDATDVAVVSNSAGVGGDGAAESGTGGSGGGFGINADADSADLVIVIERSSFDGNRAGDGGVGGTAGGGGDGGAVYNPGSEGPGPEGEPPGVTATNVTFVRNAPGNSANGDLVGFGGAIAAKAVQLTHATVTDNAGPLAVAGPRLVGAIQIIATASVFGANEGENCLALKPSLSGGDNYQVGGLACFSSIAETDRVVDAGSDLGLGPIIDGAVGVGREPAVGGPLDAAIPVARCADGRAIGVSSDQWSRVRPRGSGCEPGALEIADVDAAARFVELGPTRLFDTRPGEPGDDPKGKVPPGGTIEVQVLGRAGVPDEAVAIAMNVTGADATDRGFVTAWPTGINRPLSSNINLTAPGQVRPNLVMVPIGENGTVSFFSQRGAHLLADVAGYFVDVDEAVAAGRIVTVDPFRLFDTRPGESAPGPKGKVGPGESISVPVLGQGSIPASGVAAIVINLIGADATDRGFVTAWGDGDRPTASVLNLSGPGATAPNLAVVPVGADGSIRLFSQSGAHLLGDVTGYVTAAGASASVSGLFVPLAPFRVFDTRPSEPAPGPKGYVDADESIAAVHAGAGTIPADAAGVVANVTASEAARRGFITAWPGGPRPTASVLNLAGPGDARPNLTILPVGDDSNLSFYASQGAHLLSDTFGYLLD
ncbi:MAG: hypothetical protein AAGA42_10910 [Actinomycetota bacterium]